MAQPDEDTEKSHEPTPHKLQEARKKGDLARSADLTAAASYGGFLLTGLALGAATVDQAGSLLLVLLDRADSLADLVFTGGATSALPGLFGALTLALLGWFLIPAGIALLSVIAQRAFVFAPDKVKPKLSRINPIENAKKKYGMSGLFEFAKSFAKLFSYSVVLGIFLVWRLDDMAAALFAGPGLVAALMARMMVEFMFIVLVISLAIGAVDYIWQRHDFLRGQRMSHREVREEHKQHEGDPHLKQERRQRGHQIASQQMMADVPGADVVIVNPTHYAVALKWARTPGSAPVCVAKGVDHVAHTIRELAIENGVPIHHDPPTARALYATTDLGVEIDPDHYRAVAAAIRFAEAMRRRARSFG